MSFRFSESLSARRALQVALICGSVAAVWSGLKAAPTSDRSPVTEAQAPGDTTPFMRAKLASSQLVLEGLVTEQFDLIAKGAAQMKAMSQAAEWPRSPDKVYDHHSEEFRRLASQLERLAKSRNLEGASFTHMHMTSVCIRCHNYVRGSLRIANDPDGEPGSVLLIPSEWPE